MRFLLTPFKRRQILHLLQVRSFGTWKTKLLGCTQNVVDPGNANFVSTLRSFVYYQSLCTNAFQEPMLTTQDMCEASRDQLERGTKVRKSKSSTFVRPKDNKAHARSLQNGNESALEIMLGKDCRNKELHLSESRCKNISRTEVEEGHSSRTESAGEKGTGYCSIKILDSSESSPVKSSSKQVQRKHCSTCLDENENKTERLSSCDIQSKDAKHSNSLKLAKENVCCRIEVPDPFKSGPKNICIKHVERAHLSTNELKAGKNSERSSTCVMQGVSPKHDEFLHLGKEDDCCNNKRLNSFESNLKISSSKPVELTWHSATEDENGKNNNRSNCDMQGGAAKQRKSDTGGKGADRARQRHDSDYKSKVDFSDMGKLFHTLMQNSPGGVPKSEKDKVAEVFRHFLEEGWAAQQASSRLYVNSILFPIAVSRFRKFFISRSTPDIRSHVIFLGASKRADCFLFPLFSEFCSREFPEEIARYRALVETADLTKPHTWFPAARAMKRRIVYHAGPTNSGKTYNALLRFKEASSGVYCSPLRLLAMEVYDGANASGVYCSLMTGQDRREVPFANHISCTVEMVPIHKTWDVAVIDEIQMLTDVFRGWAWTRAILGVLADEVHVCGDSSVLPLIRDMCAVTGDELEERFYERFEPLSVDENTLRGSYAKIKPGDCIVSFSRKEIFSIKRAVELSTRNRCCVVYGALPPETRSHQAKLFNDPDSGYNVLVATDAVGMGLNLNIRRVVFYTFEKYNGETKVQVSPSQVKQIAGRAGRRGTIYPYGSATTFYSQDMPYLLHCLNEPVVESHSAGLFPSLDQMELFASQLPDATFSKLLDHFADTCQVDGSYFLCRNDNLKKVASIIDKVRGLTLEEKMKFILTPVNTRDQRVVGALHHFALAYSERLPVHLSMVAPTESAKNDLQLMDLEAQHQVLSLYLWLGQHFLEEYFPQREQAENLAGEIALLLGESLVQTDLRTMESDKRGLLKKRTRSKSNTCKI